jgi:hypothetical protein
MALKSEWTPFALTVHMDCVYWLGWNPLAPPVWLPAAPDGLHSCVFVSFLVKLDRLQESAGMPCQACIRRIKELA